MSGLAPVLSPQWDPELLLALAPVVEEIAAPYREAVAGLAPTEAIAELEEEARAVLALAGSPGMHEAWPELRTSLRAQTDAAWIEHLCVMIAVGLMTQQALSALSDASVSPL